MGLTHTSHLGLRWPSDRTNPRTHTQPMRPLIHGWLKRLSAAAARAYPKTFGVASRLATLIPQHPHIRDNMHWAIGHVYVIRYTLYPCVHCALCSAVCVV